MRRNNGFGKGISFAISRALVERYGHGRYSTRASHTLRARVAVAFFEAQGIRDWVKLSTADRDMFCDYLRSQVDDGTWTQDYAVQILSTFNVVTSALGLSGALWTSPSTALGKRSNVRTEPPTGLDIEAVRAAVAALDDAGLSRVGTMVLLARGCGMRLRESILANGCRLAREMHALDRVNVIDGTKGGRREDRWIKPTEPGVLGLTRLSGVVSRGASNLLGPSETFIEFVRGPCKRARQILKAHQIQKFHDLRAAFACERYEQITGHVAPVIAGRRIADSDLDWTAREEIARELGHGRRDVVASYIGGRRT